MATNYDDRVKVGAISVSGKVGRPGGFGDALFGKSYYGEIDDRAGIYRRVRSKTGIHIWRTKHYVPRSTITPALQSRRDLFASGMLAWKNLTSEEKAFYNNLTYPKNMHGVNRFMRLYMRGEVQWLVKLKVERGACYKKIK